MIRVTVYWRDGESADSTPGEYDCDKVEIQGNVLILHGADAGHWKRMCHPIDRIDWWGEQEP